MKALLICVIVPVQLTAQVSLHGALGARYSTALVHDSIVAPVDAQPAIGPALRLSLGQRSSSAWTPSLNVDVTWASLQRHESGTSTKFNSITTLGLTVGVGRAIANGVSLSGDVGIIKYLPSEESGIFRDGSGIEALVGLGVSWVPAATRARDIGLLLRYDLHQFSTPALHNEGFTNTPQLVHRIFLGVGAQLFGNRGTAP